MRIAARPTAAVFLSIVAACSNSAEEPGDPLSRALLGAPPAGYSTVIGPASGPMTLEDAAGASAADVATKRAFLRRAGFQGGYSRVWERDDDYVTLLVHEFATRRSAERLVALERDEAARKQGTIAFSVPEVPGAIGYILSGVKRKGLDPVFCHSVWFAAGSRAFGVQACGAQPSSPSLAMSIAKDRYARAAAS